MSVDLPINAQESPEWLTSVLRLAGVLPKGEVSAVMCVPIVEQDQGSLVLRLSLMYSEPTDAPTTLIAKIPARLKLVGERLREMGGVSVARCYFSEIDTESGEFLILLEDLLI